MNEKKCFRGHERGANGRVNFELNRPPPHFWLKVLLIIFGVLPIATLIELPAVSWIEPFGRLILHAGRSVADNKNAFIVVVCKFVVY